MALRARSLLLFASRENFASDGAFFSTGLVVACRSSRRQAPASVLGQQLPCDVRSKAAMPTEVPCVGRGNPIAGSDGQRVDEVLDELPRGIPGGIRPPPLDRSEVDEDRPHSAKLHVEGRGVLEVEANPEEATPKVECQEGSGLEEGVGPLPRVGDDVDVLDGEHHGAIAARSARSGVVLRQDAVGDVRRSLLESDESALADQGSVQVRTREVNAGRRQMTGPRCDTRCRLLGTRHSRGRENWTNSRGSRHVGIRRRRKSTRARRSNHPFLGRAALQTWNE